MGIPVLAPANVASKPAMRPAPQRTPMIPGARERNTLTVRQPTDITVSPAPEGTRLSSMDARTTLERRKEGGGGSGQPSTRA